MNLEEIREDLIVLRDNALKQGCAEWTIKLSHYIAAIAQGCFEQVKEYKGDEWG